MSPVIDAVKMPTPLPLEVFWFIVVGSGVTFQQKPLEVISLPPSLSILAVAEAVVDVMFDTLVFKVGTTLGGPFLQEFEKKITQRDKITNGTIGLFFI